MDEALKLLLGAGADINHQDKEGRTALILAAAIWIAKNDAVKLLIWAGADINRQDKVGRTALVYAASEGKEEAVKLGATGEPEN